MWLMVTSCEHDIAPLDELSEDVQGCISELKSIHVSQCRNRVMALLYWIFAN